MESIKVPNVHVLGDATLSAPAMPKSGHMANQHGKAAAAAIVELLNGRTADAADDGQHLLQLHRRPNAVHVASVHRCVPEKKTLEPWQARAAFRRRTAHRGRSKALTRKVGHDDLGGHVRLAPAA